MRHISMNQPVVKWELTPSPDWSFQSGFIQDLIYFVEKKKNGAADGWKMTTECFEVRAGGKSMWVSHI